MNPPLGPTLSKIKRSNGIAGEYQISVMVQYPDEKPEQVTFVGSTYGGPIVMVTPDNHQVFVSQRVTERIGSKLTVAWVEAFFAPRTDV